MSDMDSTSLPPLHLPAGASSAARGELQGRQVSAPFDFLAHGAAPGAEGYEQWMDEQIAARQANPGMRQVVAIDHAAGESMGALRRIYGEVIGRWQLGRMQEATRDIQEVSGVTMDILGRGPKSTARERWEKAWEDVRKGPCPDLGWIDAVRFFQDPLRRKAADILRLSSRRCHRRGENTAFGRIRPTRPLPGGFRIHAARELALTLRRDHAISLDLAPPSPGAAVGDVDLYVSTLG